MRLIDADAFEEFIKEKYKDGEETDDIKDQMLFDLSYQPTIEAVPVVHGEWVKDKVGIYHCSACNEEAYWDTDYGQQLFEHCPYCGAKWMEVRNDYGNS